MDSDVTGPGPARSTAGATSTAWLAATCALLLGEVAHTSPRPPLTAAPAISATASLPGARPQPPAAPVEATPDSPASRMPPVGEIGISFEDMYGPSLAPSWRAMLGGQVGRRVVLAFEGAVAPWALHRRGTELTVVPWPSLMRALFVARFGHGDAHRPQWVGEVGVGGAWMESPWAGLASTEASGAWTLNSYFLARASVRLAAPAPRGTRFGPMLRGSVLPGGSPRVPFLVWHAQVGIVFEAPLSAPGVVRFEFLAGAAGHSGVHADEDGNVLPGAGAATDGYGAQTGPRPVLHGSIAFDFGASPRGDHGADGTR